MLAGVSAAGVLAAVVLSLGVAAVPGPVGGYVVGAVVAMASGLVVLLAPRYEPGLREPAGIPRVRIVGAIMVVRGSSWLLLAGAALDGRLTVPELGDAVNPVTGSLAIVVSLAAARGLRPHRARLLLLEIVLATSTTLLALWAVAFSPLQVGVPASVVRWCLLLVTVLVVQFVAAVLVLGAEGVVRTSPTVLGILLITVGEVAGLLTGLTTDRHVPGAALACWCIGWPLLGWRILSARTGAATSPSDAYRLRRQATTSATVLAVSGLGVLTVILTWATGLATVSPGAVTGTLMVVALGSLVLHEGVVGADRLRLTETLAEQALRDPWTGLTNRRGLSDRIRALPHGTEWAVLTVDLDGFKTVNDVHGHAYGDSVLAEVAAVLRAHCPLDGVTARTGGDEFAMLVPGDVERGREIGLGVVVAMPGALAPLRLAVPITASVGVGRLVPGDQTERRPASGGDADPLTPLVEASAALRAAKAGGRNRVQIYPGHVARLRERRLLVESRLRHAIGAGTPTAVGQPVVDLATGRMVGIEALARWEDPELGPVPPSEFVAVAEETGLVADLGTLVLRSALTGFAAHGFVDGPLVLGINASPIQLRDAAFPDEVRRLVDEVSFPADRLVVEVTEAVLVEAGDPALRVLGGLTALGVRIAIDDFGSGYSALGYLRRLPVDAVKLDRSLLLEARTTMRTRHMLAGLVELARRLGVTVVVEGIEDEPDARLATEVGAGFGQGFLLGRPDGWAELAARYRAQPSRRPSDESSGTITQ